MFVMIAYKYVSNCLTRHCFFWGFWGIFFVLPGRALAVEGLSIPTIFGDQTTAPKSEENKEEIPPEPKEEKKEEAPTKKASKESPIIIDGTGLPNSPDFLHHFGKLELSDEGNREIDLDMCFDLEESAKDLWDIDSDDDCDEIKEAKKKESKGSIDKFWNANAKFAARYTYKSCSRNYSRKNEREFGAYDNKRNYVTRVEEIPTRRKLAQDALLINQATKNDKEKSSTTIFCFVLRDKNRYVKKFVAHNSADPNPMPKPMRARARDLGYDIINSDRAHAEGQFLQFLYDRSMRRPGLYTHILGMGCNRLHCIECDCLLRLILGKNYRGFTTAMTLGIENGYVKSTISGEADNKRCFLDTPYDVQQGATVGDQVVEDLYKPNQHGNYEYLKDEKGNVTDVKKKNCYPNYPIPPGIQTLIANRLGIPIDGIVCLGRYAYKTDNQFKTERKEKKRKKTKDVQE
jgi:hypothetical protein